MNDLGSAGRPVQGWLVPPDPADEQDGAAHGGTRQRPAAGRARRSDRELAGRPDAGRPRDIAGLTPPPHRTTADGAGSTTLPAPSASVARVRLSVRGRARSRAPRACRRVTGSPAARGRGPRARRRATPPPWPRRPGGNTTRRYRSPAGAQRLRPSDRLPTTRSGSPGSRFIAATASAASCRTRVCSPTRGSSRDRENTTLASSVSARRRGSGRRRRSPRARGSCVLPIGTDGAPRACSSIRASSSGPPYPTEAATRPLALPSPMHERSSSFAQHRRIELLHGPVHRHGRSGAQATTHRRRIRRCPCLGGARSESLSGPRGPRGTRRPGRRSRRCSSTPEITITQT